MEQKDVKTYFKVIVTVERSAEYEDYTVSTYVCKLCGAYVGTNIPVSQLKIHCDS